MKNFSCTSAVLLLFFFASCNSSPKVVESEPVADQGGSAISQVLPGVQPAPAENHKVVAEEALNTERYTYVKVSENGEHFWIAIPKTPVEIGATYYYQGGLMKKNFQSREFNRVFETLYLVSGILTEDPAAAGSAVDQAVSSAQNREAVAPPKEVKAAAGAIKIAELVGNLKKYEGKMVKITGKCVKVNPMIMGRNWVHLQDGSAKNFDLTVTTTEQVELGSIITLEGTIALNKDFGAGYKYDVIMESATRK